MQAQYKSSLAYACLDVHTRLDADATLMLSEGSEADITMRMEIELTPCQGCQVS